MMEPALLESKKDSYATVDEWYTRYVESGIAQRDYADLCYVSQRMIEMYNDPAFITEVC